MAEYGKIEKSICRRLKFSKKEDQLIRKRVFERDHFTCQRCGVKPKKIPRNYNGRYTVTVELPHLEFSSCLVVDHIVPWKQGGTIKETNLQTLCDSCNSAKGDQSELHSHKKLGKIPALQAP